MQSTSYPLLQTVNDPADLRRLARPELKQLAAELQKARESDTPEVELLRDAAYNDLVREVGRSDLCTPLSLGQRMASALA